MTLNDRTDKIFQNVLQMSLYIGYCYISDAYENARFLCEQYYATAPGCDIECYNRKLQSGYCLL